MTKASPRGRSRSESSRQAILAAAAEIAGRDGYGAVSIERIARESGTGKQTIYRWWPTKADVVMEALIGKVSTHIPAVQTGSLEGDLAQFLESSAQLARAPQVVGLLAGLAADAQHDPGFADRFRDSFVAHRRAALTEILARYAPPEGPVSVGTLVDVVFGVFWYRVLIMPAPLDDGVIRELTQVIIRSLETRP